MNLLWRIDCLGFFLPVPFSLQILGKGLMVIFNSCASASGGVHSIDLRGKI
jgi:hypothetical protein